MKKSYRQLERYHRLKNEINARKRAYRASHKADVNLKAKLYRATRKEEILRYNKAYAKTLKPRLNRASIADIITELVKRMPCGMCTDKHCRTCLWPLTGYKNNFKEATK